MNLNRSIELLEYLSKFKIVYGVLDSEKNLKLKVNILNTDNTITPISMKAEEVMFFTEYGSLTVPGKFILGRTTREIDKILDDGLNKIIDEILNDNSEVNESYINTQMNEICLKIQNYLRNYIRSFPNETNVLGKIIHPEKDENRYFYDMDKLSNYITCVAKFKN